METIDLRKEYYFQGNNIGCLLIHGFTSTPAELRELGERIREKGYTVLGIRLKGHGTTMEDMEKCSFKDWIESVAEGLKRLQETCDEIYVIGHSMGSLLALYIAENFEIDKVIALSPPLIVKNKASKFAFIAKYFMRYADWEPRERTEEELKYLLSYGRIPVRSLHELNKLTSKVKKDLNKINKPLLIVHSTNDELVENSSVDLLYNSASTTDKVKVFIHNSGHNITVEKEKGIVFNAVLDFI